MSPSRTYRSRYSKHKFSEIPPAVAAAADFGLEWFSRIRRQVHLISAAALLGRSK